MAGKPTFDLLLTYFWSIFDLLSEMSRKPTFDLFFAYFDFFEEARRLTIQRFVFTSMLVPRPKEFSVSLFFAINSSLTDQFLGKTLKRCFRGLPSWGRKF